MGRPESDGTCASTGGKKEQMGCTSMAGKICNSKQRQMSFKNIHILGTNLQLSFLAPF